MKILKFAVILLCAATSLGCDDSSQQSVNYHGFVIAPPYRNVKEQFLITETDSQFVPAISSASESIARFAIDLYSVPPGESKPQHIRQVDQSALKSLRLPPPMPGTEKRFMFHSFYCWSMPDSEHLEFLIEWAHHFKDERYTDSYIFRRTGSGWTFDRHGKWAPWYSKESPVPSVRQCPRN